MKIESINQEKCNGQNFPLKYLESQDHQHKTFVTLNIFCQLSWIHSHLLLLRDKIKLNGMVTKIKWKADALLTVHFKIWRYFLQRYSHQFFYLLLFYISFYIIRCNFSHLLRASLIIISKKIFVTIFFNVFTWTFNIHLTAKIC